MTPLVITTLLMLQQSPAEFRSPNGLIRLRNYSTIASDSVTGETVITGDNGPMVLEDTGRGLTLSGLTMRVTLQSQPDGTRLVRSAKIDGRGQVVIDSEAAYKAAVTKLATTPKPDSFSRTQIDSEQFDYQVKDKDGILTLPQPAKIKSDSHGDALKKKAEVVTKVPFIQTLVVNGSKGVITLDPAPTEGVFPVRTGHLDGPVTFTLDRTETSVDATVPGGTKIEKTHVDGKSDAFDADLAGAKEPTLTATGNVVLVGDGTALGGRVNGDKAIITLDAEFRPIRYNFVGTPATTKVNLDKPRTGGGR